MYHTDGKKARIHQYKSVGKRKGPNRKVHNRKNRLFRKETQMLTKILERAKNSVKVSQYAQRHFRPDWKDFLILILSSTAKGMGS